MKKDIIIGVLLLIIGVVIGWLCRPNHIRDVTKKVTDTLVVRDTHIIEKPILIEQTVRDSLLVQVHDTIRINDTIFVVLPIEKKIYKGEDYLAEISGYKPNLERIEVYPKTTTIREVVPQMVSPTNRLALGVEATYINTLSIPIYLEYGRMLHENVEIYGRILRDVKLDQTGVAIGTRIQFGW